MAPKMISASKLFLNSGRALLTKYPCRFAALSKHCSAKDPLQAFLQQFMLTEDQKAQFYKTVCTEISKGLHKEEHETADIKNYLTYVQDLPNGQEIGNYMALDLGGSNFRVLGIKFKGTTDIDIDSKTFALDPAIMTGTGVQLFDHIAKCLSDFVVERKIGEATQPLGFTFSFPCTQLGLRKALLVRWTKGFSASGVIGEDIGQMLIDAIARRGDLHIKVIGILNDTTGTLMSCAHRHPDCRIGVIVGTGCNACYVEKVENIQTLEEKYKNKPEMIINTEWGALGENGCIDFVRTDVDRMVDCKSINKGGQIFEKMLSGMYLSQIVRWTIHKLVEEKLIFADDCSISEKIKALLEDSSVKRVRTKHFSEIALDQPPCYPKTTEILKQTFGIEDISLNDVKNYQFISELAVQRSGILVGIAVASLINRIDNERITVAVDGSVFRYHPHYKNYMREVMEQFVDKHIKFDLRLSEDGSGRGAALVAAVSAKE